MSRMKTQPFAGPHPRWFTSRRMALGALLVVCLGLLLTGTRAHAQQFNSDNQWTAPHGVGTVIGTVGHREIGVTAQGCLRY